MYGLPQCELGALTVNRDGGFIYSWHGEISKTSVQSLHGAARAERNLGSKTVAVFGGYVGWCLDKTITDIIFHAHATGCEELNVHIVRSGIYSRTSETGPKPDEPPIDSGSAKRLLRIYGEDLAERARRSWNSYRERRESAGLCSPPGECRVLIRLED